MRFWDFGGREAGVWWAGYGDRDPERVSTEDFVEITVCNLGSEHPQETCRAVVYSRVVQHSEEEPRRVRV